KLLFFDYIDKVVIGQKQHGLSFHWLR
ncbi:MAG: hypothetical protein RLZZ345_978, partial [Actinomycetota bacterium]